MCSLPVVSPTQAGLEPAPCRYNVSLICNKMPIALASCSPYVVWDVTSPSGRFDLVYLDGRVANFDFNEPQDELTMLWEVRVCPCSSLTTLCFAQPDLHSLNGILLGRVGAGNDRHDREPQPPHGHSEHGRTAAARHSRHLRDPPHRQRRCVCVLRKPSLAMSCMHHVRSAAESGDRAVCQSVHWVWQAARRAPTRSACKRNALTSSLP
jgi:hypothetical protein